MLQENGENVTMYRLTIYVCRISTRSQQRLKSRLQLDRIIGKEIRTLIPRTNHARPKHRTFCLIVFSSKYLPKVKAAKLRTLIPYINIKRITQSDFSTMLTPVFGRKSA